MRTDHTELDNRILAAVKAGKGTFVSLHVAVGYEHDFRLIDRRLQALRKVGALRFVRGKGAHWEVVERAQSATKPPAPPTISP